MNEQEFIEIKNQILKQLESSQVDNKKDITEAIEKMSPQELEEFVKKNSLLKEKQTSECVFCSITQGKTQSYKLEENKKSLAILEINPLSQGHSLVLSKNHDKLPSQALTLANKLAKRIKSKLKPEEVKIETSNILGHNLVQVIPIFKDKKLEKKQASEKELVLLQEKLRFKPRQKKPKPQIKVERVLEKAPKRFP
ncbi:MAG: hypothetical protein NT076_01785 [Candidatus Pacearchaeota archaeon]|nr:hypothetical protein [Candidatus Pacearchaeota archaeon]